MHIPAYALTDAETWTPSLVLPALVHALRTFRAMPIQIGPAQPRSFLGDSAGDEWPENRVRFVPRQIDVERAHKVLVGFVDDRGRKHPAWLNGGLVGYPDQRMVISRWAKWASHGKVTFDGISQTEEEFADQVLRMSKSTMIRRRDFAAQIIARGLNEAELGIWYVEERTPRKNRMVAASAAA